MASVAWLGWVVRSTEGGEPRPDLGTALLPAHWHELAPSEGENEAPDSLPSVRPLPTFRLGEVTGSAERQRQAVRRNSAEPFFRSGLLWPELRGGRAPAHPHPPPPPWPLSGGGSLSRDLGEAGKYFRP